MDYQIRKIRESEYSILSDFLYEAIFIPKGMEKPPRSIIEQSELQVYIADFGKADDWCLVAEMKGKIIGAVWVRIMNDYGHIDNETPSLAISLYNEYRHLGIGTALMKAILQLLKEKGYKQISLSVQKENYAVNMYRKIGFKIVSETEEQHQKYLELMSLVGKDYYIYREKLEDCSNRELIDRAEEIAAVMAAYHYLAKESSLSEEGTNYLLRFNRPLVEIVKYWPTASMNADIAMERFIHGISSHREERAEMSDSMRERLQHAVREVQDRPATEKTAHEPSAR